MRAWWLAGLLLVAAPDPAQAGGQGPDPSAAFDDGAALAASRAALGRTLGDYRFYDRRGRPVKLAEWRGRPLLISLVYTSCYHTCSMLTRNLARAVEIAREALGEDSFTVLTVGFDVGVDTPQRMASFARERQIDLPGWRFLSGDAAAVAGLSRDLGFSYARSPKGFDHTAQTTVVDARGRVYRQVYGDEFPPPSLVEPLKQLLLGAKAEAAGLAGWVNGVRLLCTVYDPASGRYRFDYSIFVAAFVGVVCLGAVAVFVVRAWRESPPAVR